MKKNGMHLYQQIQDYIIDMIHSHELEPGDKLPSEHELSKKMKVSRLTVRKAYIPLIEKGILSAFQGKGTFVSDSASLSMQEFGNFTDKGFHTKKVIGIVFPEITVFFGPILKEIEDIASKNNFALNIMFNDTFERESNAISTMLANKIDGIIITPIRNASSRSIENYMRLVESGVPMVMIGKPPFEIECDCVMCDDILGAFTVVDDFIKAGHEKILHVYNSDDDEEALYERSEGYRKAISKSLPGQPLLELDSKNIGWETQLLELVANQHVTAIFADTDTCAAQIHFLKLANPSVFPAQLPMVAYSATNVFQLFNIDIPTIEIPKEEMGRKAIEILKNKIEASFMSQQEECYHHVIFKPKV